MDKDYLIQLTQNLYRLTLLFPKKEPLRYKMRELADEIFAKLVSFLTTNPKCDEERPRHIECCCIGDVGKDMEILDGFFEVAKVQNWVPVVDILRLQKEYNKIETEIKKIASQSSKPLEKEIETVDANHKQTSHKQIRELVVPTSGGRINERQQKILEFIKENGKAQVWQLKQIFPEVTKRTLRRDFEFLLKQGKIERIGERNNTFYRIKGY